MEPPPIPLNDDGPIAWIVRPSFGSPHRPKLQATSSRPRRHPCVGDDATQRSRRMDITSSCRRCSFPPPRKKRLPMARPTAAPTMQLSPTQSADDFAHSRIDQRRWSWPSCATKTCARFWRVTDFPESIEEVRPPWSPVWCAGCTRGPRVLSPSPGACSVHRDRPPHRTVDRALARMLAVVPPLGRPRRPTTCRSMTSMPRLSCRRPTRFSYLEHLPRPWTWTFQTKTQIERPTATSRPSLPFCRQFLPFPLRRASSRLQPPILHPSRSPLPARHQATQPLCPEHRQRSPVHQALRRSPPFSSARKRRCKLSSKLQPLSTRIQPVQPPGPSSRNSHPSPCVELAVAHAGIATADALRPSRASDPPSVPERPPPDQPSRAAPLAAWDDHRCIVVDPLDDRLRRAATDIEGNGRGTHRRASPRPQCPPRARRRLASTHSKRGLLRADLRPPQRPSLRPQGAEDRRPGNLVILAPPANAGDH